MKLKPKQTHIIYIYIHIYIYKKDPVQPSEKAKHMFGTSSVGASQSIDGSAFTDFVAECDLARFGSFMESTQTWSLTSSVANTPPASIQVHLQDLRGTVFKAQLFHACIPMPSNVHSGHIFGIKEVNASAQDVHGERFRIPDSSVGDAPPTY